MSEEKKAFTRREDPHYDLEVKPTWLEKRKVF